MEIQVHKVIRVAAGEEAAAWRDALSAPGALDGARVLKEDAAGGSWVRRMSVRGREVVVKCRVLNTLGRKLKHATGMGHGAKHWRGAERLKKAGILTGKPLALVRAEIDGKACEVMVLEWVWGETLLEALDAIAQGIGLGVKEQHRLAREIGAHVRAMIEGYCANRDHKPSNLVVQRRKDGAHDIVVIDCVGIGEGRNYRDQYDGVDDMLACLMIEPMGCGCRPRRALWMRAFAAARPEAKPKARRGKLFADAWRDRVSRIARRIAEHGDARPRVDPLGRR